MKPNLWLLVNPNIACPIQYGPAEELDPPPAELRVFAAQEDLLLSVAPSTEVTVQFTQTGPPGGFSTFHMFCSSSSTV